MRWTALVVVLCLLSLLVIGCQEEGAKKAATSAPAEPTKTAEKSAATPAPAPAPTPAPAPDPAPTSAARWQGDGISWVTPGGWSTIAGEGLRFASLKPASGPEIAVTRFPGLVGGLEANINRWRNQVGLPPAPSREEVDKNLKDLKIDGHDGWLADLTGPEGKMLAIMLPEEAADGEQHRMWFFKMLGKPDLIEAQRSAFMQWSQSIRIGK